MHKFYEVFIVFSASFSILLFASIIAYHFGSRDKENENIKNSEIISTSILGLLALFLGFSFSMAVTRYENRRTFAVDEANAISTAYLRSTLLNEVKGVNLRKLYADYIDSRIKFYEERLKAPSLETSSEIQNKIWEHLILASKKNRGALEGAYTYALTEMFDAANTRNYALTKTLPITIYLMILIIGVISFSILLYDRGFRGENSHGRFTGFIILFCMLFTLIYDLDHSNTGVIRIGQDALLDLYKLVER